MNVRINGAWRELEKALSIPELLDLLKIPHATALVELNGQALRRNEWPPGHLAEGDRLEILRIAAGG